MTTKYPPGQGYAWREGWQERLSSLVRDLGFNSVTEFVESKPCASLVALADELGGGDVAAVQIEWSWVAEAEASGTMERCARGLLTRALRMKLPEGWHRQWVDVPGDPKTPRFRKTRAFVSFSAALPKAYEAAADRICLAFDTAEIPEGWIPKDADDPVVIDIFHRHWSP